MLAKRHLSVSVLVLAAACGNRSAEAPDEGAKPPGRTADEVELLRARAFVDARYATTDVKSSFKTKLGDTIDCIDFFAQPGVKALAARGTPITELVRPAQRRARSAGGAADDDVGFDGSIDENGDRRECSDTTVPQVRVSIRTILEAGGLDPYLKHLTKRPPALPHAPPDGAGPAYAHAQASYSGTAPTFPVDRATVSIWTPAMPANDTVDHSLEQTWTLSTGASFTPGAPCAPSCLQTVEAGWTVDRGLNGDGNPHLFIFSTADGYQTGSYNGLSGGPSWVSAPHATFAPGMTLPSSNTTPGSELTIQVSQCSVYNDCPGGWEIQVRTASNAPLEYIGYYPASNYGSTFKTAATAFIAGGEVYDSRDLNVGTGADTFALPMGNGTVASGGFGKAAYVHDLYVFPPGQGDPDLAFGTPASTVPQYGVFPAGPMGNASPGSPENEAGWLNFFYLGAPPPPCVPRTCGSDGATCGTLSDGCGGSISCGSCSGGATCSSNRCVAACKPLDCSAIAKNCGTWSDGCGATLTCGSCPSSMVCQTGVCVGSGGQSGKFCANCEANGGICTTYHGVSRCIYE